MRNKFLFCLVFTFCLLVTGCKHHNNPVPQEVKWEVVGNKLPTNNNPAVMVQIDSLIIAVTPASINNKLYATLDTFKTLLPIAFNYGTIYNLSVYDKTLFAGTPDGVYYSTDYGINWGKINTGIPIISYPISYLVKGNSNYLTWQPYVGPLLTQDYKTSWSLITKGTDNLNGSLEGMFEAINDDYYLIGANTAYKLRLTDSTWVQDSNSFFILPSNSEFKKFEAEKNYRLICYSQYDPSGNPKIYTRISNDNGSTWNETENEFLYTCFGNDIICTVGYFNSQNGSAIKKSTDNGKTWSTINFDLPKEYVYTISIIGSYIYAFTEGGVYRMSLN